MSGLKTFFNDNDTGHLMLDLRASSTETITYDDVSDLFRYATSRTNDSGENRGNGKTALVVSGDLQSEVQAIFKTCFKTEDLPINVWQDILSKPSPSFSIEPLPDIARM